MKRVCMLIGLLRAFGRFSPNVASPLISNIFPTPFKKPMGTEKPTFSNNPLFRQVFLNF